MMRRLWMAWIAVWLIGLTVACSRPEAGRNGQGAGEVTVFAAAQLTESFTEMKEAFARKYPGVQVTLNFAGSQILRTQIEHGAPVDVFASANLDHMEALVRAGLVEAHQPFSWNRLALIVPRNNPAGITSLQDLGTKRYRLVVGVPEVPIGQYTRQMLEKASQAYGADFKDRVLANAASMETDTKKVAARVSLGEADAAVAYITDITPKMASTVQQIPFPDQFNLLSTNTIAVLKKAPHSEWGKRWVEFVFSDEGQQILGKYRFVTVAEKARSGQ